MFKFLWIFSLLIIMSGCKGLTVPPDFDYKVISTRDFDIVVWQKIRNPGGVYKFYIEGDGHAFNSRGQPTTDPTPQGTLVRELAFSDPSPNVIYVSRPCQYIRSRICRQRHWSTARFAPEVVNAEYAVIKQIAGTHSVILIGFSGGAQIAGLVASAKSGLNVKKIITIAGNLDHLSWTEYHHLPPLRESLNLADYRADFLQVPQQHYVGSEDDVIPPQLVKSFVGDKAPVITVDGAGHNSGWSSIFPLLHQEQ